MKRLGILCGLIGPMLFLVMVTGLTILQYDFLLGLGWHPLRAPTFDWPSGLALGPYGGLMTATFVLCGAMMSLFALRLGADLSAFAAVQLRQQPNAARIGSGLFAIAGLALMGLAFTTDPTGVYPALRGSTPATWHGRLHDASFVMLGLSLLPGMLVLGRAFHNDARWRGLAIPTWAAAALVIPAFILKGAAFYVFLAAVLLWSEMLAWRFKQISDDVIKSRQVA
ncbi:MAG TPA: DUF998 domain-containing protein [Anaerolineales bacterium]|jgi:hypothetical protein